MGPDLLKTLGRVRISPGPFFFITSEEAPNVKLHKFAIGQLVDFDAKFVFDTRIVPTPRTQGPYEVLRVLPADDLKPRIYRIKSQAEPFERNANEYEIVAIG